MIFNRSLVIFISILSFNGLGQISIELNGGVSEVRKQVPSGYIEGLFSRAYSGKINYFFKSSPVEVNLASHFGFNASYYQSVNNNQIDADFDTKFAIMSGIGMHSTRDFPIQAYCSMQFGYWNTKLDYNLQSFNGNQPFQEDYRVRINQFVFGPLIGLRIGQTKLQGLIQFEQYFFSTSGYANFGSDRVTTLSLGLCYRLGSKD
jgi:hypothetical protein